MLRSLANIGLRLGIALLLSIAATAHAQRYWALLQGGETRTGEQLRHRAEPERALTLDGSPLLDKEHRLRLLRDVRATPAKLDTFVELTNGDRFAGRVSQAALGDEAGSQPDHLIVGNTRHSGPVRVRLDWVRRIASRGHVPRPWEAGFLHLENGRQVVARSIRWERDRIKALHDDGILDVPFEDIVELHVPQQKPWLAPYPGAKWLDDDMPPVVRTNTTEGETFTYPRRMVTTKFNSRRLGASKHLTLAATRPPWSLDVILFDLDSVCFQNYFGHDEVPLSLLPITAAREKAAVHHLLWQRDRSVHGQLLQCGEIAANLGIGMHSYTRLAFALPPHAREFSTYVGLDRLAGSGGCVHCRIFRDDDQQPLWEHRFLHGSDGLQTVGPLDIQGAKQLALEVDFADEGRPQGADPLDIRDWVNWVLPTLRIDAPAESHDDELLAQAVPAVEGWSVSPEMLRRLKLRPYWVNRSDDWSLAIRTGGEPLVLSQKVHVTLQHAWLPVRATRDDDGEVVTISVQADGQKVGSTMNGDLGTHDRKHFGERTYTLHEHAGKTVKVEVIARRHRQKSGQMAGVAWDALRLQPLIRNLPPSGQPIAPDVPLESLSPLNTSHRGKPVELRPGNLTNGEELNVRRWEFNQGYGVPTGTDVTYRLDSSWRKFVAVIGLADGWKGAGPYQILLDDQLHWSSQRDYARNDQGEQIVVGLPPGHETITLRLLGDESGGAWAHAGFLTK